MFLMRHVYSIHPMERAYIYGIQSGLFIKVGWTRNLEQRLHLFQAGNPHPIRIAVHRTVRSDIVCRVENRTHYLLHKYAIGREWFMTDVGTVRQAIKQALADVEKYEGACQRHRQDPSRHPLPEPLIVNPFNTEARIALNEARRALATPLSGDHP